MTLQNKRMLVSVLMSVGVVAAVALASNVTIPNNFVAGTPAVAAQVNANFQAVKTAVDDTQTQVTALQGGCPGAVFGATCLLKWDNSQSTNFQTAAQTCANLGGDICTDSQLWPIAVGNWQSQYLVPT